MRILLYILLLLVLITAGCGVYQKKNLNQRIVYRDLTIPDNVEGVGRGYDDALDTAVLMNQSPIHFVDFKSGSSRNFDKKALKEALKKADKNNDNIFVLGHSHGNSAGTIKLSTGRAGKVGAYLRNQGFKKVFLMAFWGKEPLPFSPDRGVQIYILKNLVSGKVPLLLCGVSD